MHPIFPELLFLGPYIAPIIVRLALGVAFIVIGMHIHKKVSLKTKIAVTRKKIVYILSLLIGVLFIIGLFTQGASIVGALLIGYIMVEYKETPRNILTSLMYSLMLVMCLSLLLTGAGGFAFDLPY